MRKCTDILRLHAAGFSERSIAKALQISRFSVNTTLDRAKKAGLEWPACKNVTPAEMKIRLFPPAEPRDERPLPDFSHILSEKRRKGVNLRLLWEEYIIDQPTGYRFTRFCELYRNWKNVVVVCLGAPVALTATICTVAPIRNNH